MRNILIIEDDKLLSQLLGKYLESKSYAVHLSVDGEEGFKKAESIEPDLILLDIGMPKINGFQVLEKLRSSQKLSAIPVIIISNSGEPVEIKEVKDLGVKDFIVKANLSLDEVGEKIRKVLSTGEGQISSTEKLSSEVAKEITSIGRLKGDILLIEDDSFFAELCRKALAGRGFSVSIAKDGEEGLRVLREKRPDLILLDIVMPKLNGFDVLKQIREDENPSIADLPVILLTNLYQKTDVENGKALRADAYLVKAVTDIEGVVDKIKEILGNKISK